MYTERRKGFEEWDDTVEDDRIFIKRISIANPISACSILLKELKPCSKNTLPQCAMQKMINSIHL